MTPRLQFRHHKLKNDQIKLKSEHTSRQVACSDGDILQKWKTDQSSKCKAPNGTSPGTATRKTKQSRRNKEASEMSIYWPLIPSTDARTRQSRSAKCEGGRRFGLASARRIRSNGRPAARAMHCPVSDLRPGLENSLHSIFEGRHSSMDTVVQSARRDVVIAASNARYASSSAVASRSRALPRFHLQTVYTFSLPFSLQVLFPYSIVPVF